MKLKRMVASILVLLLVVSLLPIGVMAEEPNNNPADGIIETTSGNIGTNNGTIVNNNHTVQNNVAVKNDLGENENFSPYEYGTGYIKNNNNVVQTNGTQKGGAESGIVESNNGTVGVKGDDASGNYGTINNNQEGGKVLINQNTGVVDANQEGGTIETNNGTVGYQNPLGDVAPTSGNYGTVETNNAGGKVLINQEGGTIDTNYGLVGKKNGNQLVTGDGSGNSGTVTTNYGIITQNKNLVVTNGKIGNTSGYIYKNDGKVENNEGTVWDNNGTVETNNGGVQQNNKEGTVGTNNGTVSENEGTVETNNYTVVRNDGTVITNNGYISFNYGTVNTNNIDGSVQNYNSGGTAARNTDSAAPSEEKPVVVGVGTNFGSVTNYADNKIYYGLSWGDSVDNLTSIESFVERDAERNLDEIANGIQRDGYKMTGYTAYKRVAGKDVEIDDTANYLMNAPTWLKLLWEKITGKPASSEEPKAKTTSIPTSLSAEQVRVGAYVRCGNLLFRIIEVNDDSIRVATVGKLSEEALADMLGFLKQHLSAAQIAKLIGEPELLEQELVTHFFGDRNEHIAFRASRNLFA